MEKGRAGSAAFAKGRRRKLERLCRDQTARNADSRIITLDLYLFGMKAGQRKAGKTPNTCGGTELLI